jgi:PTS system mannose-specific IID component
MSADRLGARARVAMALRLQLLQATWNYERQQGLGWAWALAPALRRFIPDAAARRERMAEHTAFFNTQPTLASLALGAAAALEAERAEGRGPDADGMARVKSVLGSSLASIGDRFFWFTLRPLAACAGVWVALHDHPRVGALAAWLSYNAAHQVIRFAGVGWGWRAGPAVLDDRLRRRFELAIRLLGLAGVAVIGAVVATLLVPGGMPRSLAWQSTLAAGLVLGLITAQRPRPSPVEWAMGIGVLSLVAAWMLH